MANVPQWQVEGDWFDVCRCDIPCPCEFARPPTDNHCEGILVWHVRKGRYGDVPIAGDLATWSASVPGRVEAKAEALTGPTTPAGKRVQTINPPGSEVGPSGTVATWGTATA